MPAPPLTHHEILELVEPFARRGRHVDLAASDRLARRLLFRPIDHAQAAPASPAFRETLQLESFGTGMCRLTRLLTLASGLQVALEAVGPQPGELLARIEAIAPQRQLQSAAGFEIARSYSLSPAVGTELSAAPAAAMILTCGVVQLEELRLTLTLSAVRGVAAELVLAPLKGGAPEFPEDLLAVLGWDWARLVPDEPGWKSRLRLRGSAQRRSRSAEIALERAAVHLARTLAAPPAAFHERWASARFGVLLRRAIPSLTAVALLAGALMLPRSLGAQGSRLLVLFFHVPTALIALSFCMQELPRFEIPPWPRRSSAPSWRRAQQPASSFRRASTG